MQRFTLGAYWDARHDDLETCVDNTAQFFARLSRIDPLLARWYKLGRSRKDALNRKANIIDIQSIRELILDGRNRRDIGREVVDELGYNIRLWNGADIEESEASLDIHCGCYSEWVGNNVLIDLPYQSESSPWVEQASSLLALVAEIWRPKWAGIMSKKAMRERDFGGDRPLVDWMVYLPRAVESVPLPGRVEALGDLGSIVVVQPELPVGNESEELPRIRQVERLLVA